MDKLIYQHTGATFHNVNDLILFSENNQDLSIIKTNIFNKPYKTIPEIKQGLEEYFKHCYREYLKEFPRDKSVKNIDTTEIEEFIQLMQIDYFEQFKEFI